MPLNVGMSKPYPPVNPALPRIWHGGDYNPDQWLDRPDILDEDFRLFPLAGVNVVSIGIFAWTKLEPSDGSYDFSWLDELMDRIAKAGMKAVLATPTGAKPAWMAQKYPEILRCGPDRKRDLQGRRHNHCYTSPVYRRKAVEINTRLARRYKDHPALLLWHVSNEYGGECHCPLCQEAFRSWLKARYGSLERLNSSWWNAFWSHEYADWSQIESPAPQGETSISALSLDWKRFVSDQSLDFFLAESAPLRSITPNVPITVNMMGTYPGLDYWKWAPHIDVASWDSYPRWHNPDQAGAAEGAADAGEADEASRTAFVMDLFRSLKGGRPWLLMESAPSQVNWQGVNRLKKPGMHRLSSLQALAHGSDSVMYFQWRKGRGGAEKFHGAVVDQSGRTDTRVFREVSELGRELEGLSGLVGASTKAEAAVLFDWETRWAIEGLFGFNQEEHGYEGDCVRFHRALWRRSIACDLPNQDQELSGYRLVIAPRLYMLKEGTADRLTRFVEGGGNLLLTFLSGYVDENDLCFEGGFPGPLRELAGVWAEELDPIWKSQPNCALPVPGAAPWLSGEYGIDDICELINPIASGATNGPEVLATYGRDWYAGRPLLTRNRRGKGTVYYLAAKTDDRFVDDLVGAIARELELKSAWPESLPKGVQAQARRGGEDEYVFLMNFNAKEAAGLPPYGCRIEKRRIE
jgi:beta-galactosidase